MKTTGNNLVVRRSGGFTLLELMVAISIFAVVSLLSMGGLNNVLSTQEHTEENMQRLTRFQMVFTIMSRELQQLADRPVRDEYGTIIDAITNEMSDGADGIEYTHQGRFTMDDNISLQRVAYYLEDKQLVKKIWQVLDRVEDSKPVKQVLLDDISDLTFSFYSIQAGNADPLNEIEWLDSPDDQHDSQLKAVRVSITTTDYDEIYRVFEVAQ